MARHAQTPKRPVFTMAASAKGGVRKFIAVSSRHSTGRRRRMASAGELQCQQSPDSCRSSRGLVDGATTAMCTRPWVHAVGPTVRTRCTAVLDLV